MFSDELNPQQLEAVHNTEGPVLVVAGAGSGKTRAITFRIVYLIREKQVPPESILAITFTNKAAKEMLDRVYQKLGASDTYPWVSTFHSFCLKLLRKHIHELGYSNDFVIYDSQDQLSLVKKCMKMANVNEEAFPPKSILGHISGFKNDYLFPSDIRLDNYAYGSQLKAATVYPVYQKALRDNNGLDFDDLLMLSVHLLRNHSSIKEYYNHRFQYVLVDEFQDTNVTQYNLVRILTESRQNVCVVGDDDQSIYRWRGANIENLLHFEKDFPETKVIKLEQNYRSTQNILKAAGAVVRENMTRKDKTLWTENGAGAKIIYYRAADETDEARAVCERIQQWANEDGLSFNDMAILYRTNAQSRVVEDRLRQLELPYQVVGGLKFYERKEVKDVLAYMRVVLNPTDSVSLKRIVNVPVRGIGKSSLDKVEAFCDQHGVSLLEGLRQAEPQNIVSTGPAKKISQFVSLMDQLHMIYEERAPEEFLNEILARTGYMSKLEKENSVEARSRLENLNELYSAVQQFAEQNPQNTLRDFLDTTALVSDQDKIDDSRGVLPLMTLHTCKGLEFEGVCMIGVENGLLPHASSMSNNEEFEEERRLCYVGITRAKKRLMLANARQRRIYGNTYTYQPSDFLSAIPGEVLEKEMSMGGYEARPSYDHRSQPEVSLPEATPRTSYKDGDYCIGTKVLHPKFGSGVVVNREGNEGDWKVVVFFKKAGKKKLAVNHANLIVV
ncbi:MAG: UvrD-helicase domain-containing protein [Nitrospinota bacterium]|nr:UvrD-helicase domain-containing protein [Nitrospinota bacterium]